MHAVVLRGMSEQADSDSLRVEGSRKGKGTESIYQLLEVQTEVHHLPKGGGHEGGAGAAVKEQAERAVEDAIAEVKRLEGKLQRIQEQAGLVQKYTEGMLTSVGSAPVGTDLDIVSKLLDFHLQRLEQADQQQLDLKSRRNMYLLSCRVLFYFWHLFLCLACVSSCLVFLSCVLVRIPDFSLSLLVLSVLYFHVLSCAFLSCLPFRVVESKSSPVEIRQCEPQAILS